MLSQLIILAVLIFLNAFFAASEIAFISLNDTKIEKQAKDGNKKAKQIEKMLKTPSKFLATIQIGITLAGFLSSAFASDTFAEKLAPILFQCMPFLSLGVWKSISIIIITIILSFFTLVFGELVPKRLAMKNYEKIAFVQDPKMALFNQLGNNHDQEVTDGSSFSLFLSTILKNNSLLDQGG